MDLDRNFFASNLKFLREKYNMEQMELAERLGRKSSSSISEWERGKYTPKAGVLNDIAKIFNVSLSELMSLDLTTPPNTDNETPQYKMIQRKAKSLSVSDQELLLAMMDRTFQDVLSGGVDDDHDF